jgi:hypothetical protein
MKQETPVLGGHGQVGLVLADDHVVHVLVGEARLLLLAGGPAALLAPAELGAWPEFPQFLHCCPVTILLLGLLRICSGILLDPLGVAMQRGRRLHRSTCTPAPGTGTQDEAERLKNSVMLVMLKERTCYLSTSSPKSLESSEITARCPKIWALISTTFPSAKKETFSTWCPVQGLVLRSLRRLAMSMQGAVPIWPLGGRSRFGHLQVATTHRNGDKPGKILTKIPTSTTTPNSPCGRCRGGSRSR